MLEVAIRLIPTIPMIVEIPALFSPRISPSNIKMAAGSVSQDVTINVIQLITPPKTLKIAKPDLVVTDIWRSGPTHWYYTVKNEGNIGSKESLSALTFDGIRQATQRIAGLAVGESRTEYFSYKYVCTSGISQQWGVAVNADIEFTESGDFWNNLREEIFTCP